MALIKSHSNFVLRKKHQDVADGTIYERDITTLGGLNQFSPGQTPIYKSGNFIITVRNDGRVSNQYNTSKWEENDSGTTWTLQNISGLTSEFEDDNDLKIVLKQDYYDFMDFAYYGSLTELFRASIGDILSRFPGELYSASGNAIYYTKSYVEDGERITVSERLGSGVTMYEVSNPFGIDIYSMKSPKDADPLKYFADNGYENYEVFQGDSENGTPITEWSVVSGESACIGNKIATIVINDNISIEAWVGDNNIVHYLYNSSETNFLFHIRPKEKFITEFYNGCDNFQKLLLNRKTTPKYKAIFSVINENEYGYYRELQEFIFPTTYGGYNIDASTYGFNEYTSRLVKIGEFYDEYFTDNLWRSMTHEAIKNFDWTYTREYQEGDEEEYVVGGQKMQKALRVFAREFDELISYINNIKNVNRVTYNERSNIPDYFLTDVVENEGWDVKLTYPFTLTEYCYISNNKVNIPSSDFTESQSSNTEEVGGEKHLVIREFAQDCTQEVYPYSKRHIKDGTEDGYFVICDSYPTGEVILDECLNSRIPNTIVKATGNTIYDKDALSGKGVIKDKIKSFTDERSYTHNEVNTEFLRRLKINSKAIWRHKGTLEGIDMILGMFGLRNKKFAKKCNKCEFEDKYDYEIIEYSSLAPYINDPWDAVHQTYRINWVNSTKAITYDNRFVSKYNTYGADESRMEYEGIPVAYRDIDGSYIKSSNNFSNQTYTTDINDDSIYRSIENGNGLVNERRLYPNFNKNEQYDGNPYFQMDGGWMSKTISINGANKYNFQYDVNNNIVASNYVKKGSATSGDYITDNDFIYKETVRNIRRTDTLNTLLSIPTNELWNGVVVYVTAPEENIMVIDGKIYNVLDEYYKPNVENSNNNGGVRHYISLIKDNGYIRVGNRFFDEFITVYNSKLKESKIDLYGKSNGYEVKAYIKYNNDNTIDFICNDGVYSIDSYNYISGASEHDTNYYVLDDVNYSNYIANYSVENDKGVWTSGWRRLNENDNEYLKLNTIENYNKGNNPHNGNMVYDNGHEYFTYFKRLFKYPIDNDLFDDRCYDDFYLSLDGEIFNYGFSGLIEDNENIKQYDSFLVNNDSKVHYFGNYRKRDDANSVVKYGDKWDNGDYTFTDDNLMIGGSPYSSHTEMSGDGVTNQIVNNKRLMIKFYLHNFGNESDWYKHQEEIKYLDDIVMNYLTQMIPSTTILNVSYEANIKEYVEIGGVKWATMNIGATSVTDYGYYFQWGDTQGYVGSQVGSGSGQKYFGWSDYKYGNGTSSPSDTGITKYNNIDHKKVLEASDDAVQAAWGDGWRMPTTQEFVALGNAIDYIDASGKVITATDKRTTLSGVTGLYVADKADRSKRLFFPSGGYFHDGNISRIDEYGIYWTSSINPSNIQGGRYMFFNSSDVYWQGNDIRWLGLPIRPVLG